MSYELEAPDSFLGTILALEGIRDGTTIIHGPTGCKLYPSDLSERLFVERHDKIVSRNAFLNEGGFFFYQPRLPCTLLDGNRLVLGANERLNELYSMICKDGPSAIGIINSPGASLTGENLDRVVSDIPTIRIDSHGYSSPMYVGFSDATIRILDTLAKECEIRKRTINVFGLSIWHLRFEDDMEELRRIFALCNVEVNCFLCAGSTVQEIENIPSAELNLVIDSDFGLRAAEYCKDRFGTPFVEECPIGFQSTERMVSLVCESLGADPKDALDDIIRWRKAAANKISVMERRYVTIRGRSFSIHSTPCIAKALSLFIHGYMGLVPVAIQCQNGHDWFPDLSIPIENDIWDTYSDISFCSGNEIASLTSRMIISGGVEISESTTMPVSIVPRPTMGTMGAVRIIEDVLNILTRINDRL